MFEMFARDFDLPSGEVIYGDKPDVTITGPRSIGIEITDLYLADGNDPDSEQVQQRHRDAVLKQAQSLHRAAGGRSIELHVAFDFQKPIRQIGPLAKAIAELGHRVERGTAGNIPDCEFDHIPELTWVYWNGVEYPDARWRVTQSYGTPLLSMARLENVVAEKSKLLSEYRACDTYWLLIVVNIWNPASDQDITVPEGATITAGGFERILLYRTHFQAVEVPTRR